MNNILNRLIQLNIELEGALRVMADRPSAEALESAKRKFAEISALFAMISPEQCIRQADERLTELKIEEAEAAESEPMAEPDLEPEAPFVPFVEDAVEPSEAPAPTADRSRHRAADLRRLFTVNDKFLFLRELFGGNESEFADTLELVAAMESVEEVNEYFFHDLQWDKDDRTVKDFISKIDGFFA